MYNLKMNVDYSDLERLQLFCRILSQIRILSCLNCRSNSVVDPDLVGFGTFWPGRIWIQNTVVVPDPDPSFFAKKICIILQI